jgi:hypothetical protein
MSKAESPGLQCKQTSSKSKKDAMKDGLPAIAINTEATAMLELQLHWRDKIFHPNAIISPTVNTVLPLPAGRAR